jgi:hypothetical protein
MDDDRKWSNRVIAAAVLLAGFGAAHLIDDFLYDIPADLGLSNELGQALAVVYFGITSLLLVLAARGNKIGYAGNLGLGPFLIAADITKHGQEGMFAGPWRTGLVSRVFAFGVILASVALVGVSYGALRHARGQT